jgi:hypothetical protein
MTTSTGIYSTADHTTISAALAAAVADGGGTVLIGPGTWTETILNTADNIWFRGYGRDTIIETSGSTMAITLGTAQGTPNLRVEVTASLGGTQRTKTIKVRRRSSTAGVGTISVTASSASFTGSGLTDLVPGSIVQIGTTEAVVLTIDAGNTSGTFLTAWSGSTAAGSAYTLAVRDLFMPDANIAVTGVTSVVLKQRPIDLTGTVTVTSGSPTMTGTGTSFDTQLAAGDRVRMFTNGVEAVVQTVNSATSVTFSANWSGLTQSGVIARRHRTITYTATTDYVVVPGVAAYGSSVREAGNNWISWAPAGAEPPAQSIYEVTYTYIPGGAVTATVASATGLAVGDYVLVSGEDQMFGWSRPEYTKGEIAQIKSIVGTTITFRQPLRDAYLVTGTIKTALIRPDLVRNNRVSDLLIRGDAATNFGLMAWWTEGLVLENVHVELENSTATPAPRKRAIGVFGAINTTIRTPQPRGAFSNSGSDYGIQLASAQSVVVDGARADAGHHTIDLTIDRYTNGTNLVGYGVCRDIVVRDCYLASEHGSREAFNTHVADNVTLQNCTVYGINVDEARKVTIAGGDVIGSDAGALFEIGDATWIDEVRITGTRFFNFGTGVSIVLRTDGKPYIHSMQRVVIDGCQFVEYPTGSSIIALGTSSASAEDSVRVGSIRITNCSATGSTLANAQRFITSALRHTIDGGELVIAGNTANAGMLVVAASFKAVRISANNLSRTPGDGYTTQAIVLADSLIPYVTGGVIEVSDNVIQGFSGRALAFGTQTATDFHVHGNTFDGNGAASTQLLVNAASTATTGGTFLFTLNMRGNKFLNTVGQTTTGCITLGATSTARLSGIIADNEFASGTSLIEFVNSGDVVRIYTKIGRNTDFTGGLAAKTVTSAYTMNPADELLLVDASAGAVTVTLPRAQNIGSGTQRRVQKIDSSANAVTIQCAGSDLINGAASIALNAQWDDALLESDGVNRFIV